MMHATTILAVRHKGKIVIGGDGQVSLGNTVMKHTASKVRRIFNNKVVGGFAGSTADAFSLFESIRGKTRKISRQPVSDPQSRWQKTGEPIKCYAD